MSTAHVQPPPLRIASVAFVNARPLIAGLDGDPRVQLARAVPSQLSRLIESDEADVALLPVIDYARIPDLTILRASAIGCDGPTLTVRLFSRSPIAHTRILACDGDSHTSVVLARIILKERFGLTPKLIPLEMATDQPGETRLLIGDKVVCEPPAGFDHQLDLGLAWKELTGLPFVFAAWCARRRASEAEMILRDSKRLGMSQITAIVQQHAIPRGWPADLAHQYLTSYLHFDLGDRQFQAIRTYHTHAARLGAIPHAPELNILPRT